MKKLQNSFRSSDFIPALSGLIGKISLISSFAVVWSQTLGITSTDFVFDNVRLEVLIAGIIALISALISPQIAPAGTLAPLVVLIPSMVKFGVHPFILSLLVGIIGIIFVKVGLLSKLILMSKHISKTSLTLVFGISGVILCIKELVVFFNETYLILALLLLVLAGCYIYLLRKEKAWLIIPVSAITALLIPLLCGIEVDFYGPMNDLVLNPKYWWEEVWGIGFGLNLPTILKTLPFALFVMLLWAMDTVAITALLDEQSQEGQKKEEINLNQSFIMVALRNIVGGICGGAQTSSLWRSFLIPLFMVKRPMRGAAILLSILCIIASLWGLPIRILAFPPLVWTVLLFGIFMPLSLAGLNKWRRGKHLGQKVAIVILAAIGIGYSPIITWLGAVVLEKLSKDNDR